MTEAPGQSLAGKATGGFAARADGEADGDIVPNPTRHGWSKLFHRGNAPLNRTQQMEEGRHENRSVWKMSRRLAARRAGHPYLAPFRAASGNLSRRRFPFVTRSASGGVRIAWVILILILLSEYVPKVILGCET